MTEEVLMLFMLVIVMLVGSYLAGSIPLVMKLSESKLNFITVLGAGLLVGTALTVIIPEGIRSLYMYSANIVIGRTTQQQLQLQQQLQDQTTSSGGAAAAAIMGGVVGAVADDTHNHQHVGASALLSDAGNNIYEDHSRTIGLSLVLGFVFMMLVDQLSQQQHNKSANLSKNEKNITATLGLVVHAAADGVALGAAATTSHHDVEIIVFLAIMLHKAPAAFGLVSFLLNEKIERQQIRKHLLIFSLSAPLLTLLTYFGIGQEQKETLNSVNATGIAMLFSGGTFLYVATVHVLPELTQRMSINDQQQHHHHHQQQQHHQTSQQNQFSQYEYRALTNDETTAATNINLEDGNDNSSTTTAATATTQRKGLRWTELTTLVCGALLPLIITFGHSH